jgi:hypothetical protein
MNHLILLLICILSIEFFIQYNFLAILNAIIKVIKKITFVLPNKKISDQWKEKIIPRYALMIMKLSLQILLIFICIISLFIGADVLLNDFFTYTFSLLGLIESMFYAFCYIKLRKLITK